MTAPLVVVTNNTPVSNLVRIGQLPLLGLLFGRVLVPQQVTPFVVALVGEYVIEIIRAIDAGLTPEHVPEYRAFLDENRPSSRWCKRGS